MSCEFQQKTIEDVIRFHGHSCPGLSIGIRASELAKQELGDLPDLQVVCITETDMCGVDAVQYLTGCTFGKGNLIHRDYGKMAFTFFNRGTDKGFRCFFKPKEESELSSLFREITLAAQNELEQARFEELRQQAEVLIMSYDLDELFKIMEPIEGMPRGARILDSIVCEACGEATMESRTRRYAGRTICQPCFDKVEQKI
jgi:formylmethanofuran dehydrogenase subunit E